MATKDVGTMITDTEARVSALGLQAGEFLLQLLNLASVDLQSDLPTSYDYAQPPQIQFPVFSAVAPSISVVTDPVPIAPAPVEFSTVETITVPDLTAAPPTLSLPALPSSTLPTAPGDAPEFVQPDVPSAPTLSLPAVPTFAALALPDAPSITMPSFIGVLPTDDLVVPSNTFSYAEAEYESILLDPLKAKLLDNLVNGGYGIETADEQALFQRTRDREVENAMTRIDEAGRLMAARGFPLPPGELSIEIDRAYQDLQNKVSSTNREITLERSKLYVENRQFTITEVRGIETVLINFHNSVQERALNVAKATFEASLAIYDALVKRFSARLERYKAEASAFADLIRGELVKAEIYKTQTEAVAVSASMQRNLVEVYKAQLEGIGLSVNIYRTQMEAANIRAQIERQKLDAFRSKVEAYQAQVQAKSAEFSMYTAAVQGQVARSNIYESEVRAYGQQVLASKTRSDVMVARLTAEVEQARARNTQYQTQVDAFKARAENLISTGRLRTDIYRADIDRGRALTDGYQANAQLFQQGILATTQQNTDISRLQVENAKARLAEAVATLTNRTEIIKYSADKFYGQVVATLNAIQTLAVQTEEA